MSQCIIYKILKDFNYTQPINYLLDSPKRNEIKLMTLMLTE